MLIQSYLAERNQRFETLLHPPASSATYLARCIRVPGKVVAKAVLVRVEQSYVLCVLPSTHRVDLVALGSLLAVSETPKIAGESEVTAVFYDCEPGVLPPFGSVYGLRTLVDTSLGDCESIIFEANTRYESLKMDFTDYERIESPSRARFASKIETKRTRTPKRRAG